MLNNQTVLDNFMVNPELISETSPTKANCNRHVNDDGVYLVGFCGMFRTSRR
tara:strand:+ start:211 stop:366 length:156 start_codon:yes stop_codon:yes gene_type:complete